MPQVYSDPIIIEHTVNRVIDHLKGGDNGPTLVFFAGIHGNEPAGVLALQQVFENLREKRFKISGNIYGLAGNLNALQKQIRYQDEDLNRIWNSEKLQKVNESVTADLHSEEREMLWLYEQLLTILNNSAPPFYFIDLHTTSSETLPFIVMNDSMLNRRFVMNYPLPKVLGIEEYLHGALLSFINEMGYVSFGFESGQHDEPSAVSNNIDFIHYTLLLTSSVQANKRWSKQVRGKVHKMSGIASSFFEITYEHRLTASDEFEMSPGFVNFQKVQKGVKVATYNADAIVAEKTTQIFMPLYQTQGSEGFYYIQPIPKFFLWLSKYLRKVKLDNLLTKLPGVQWQDQTKRALVLDTRIAKYISKSIFHLLGYRVRQVDASHLVLRSREAASRENEYPKSWK
ncbi:succinylglutamate desuccinylase/aspartoacylase family protein [uncultured Croceitalea sp.]|uniref:succinylglutamate desuccinylase/aspartoacylase domain-containing protein n=1 Tax=uncultured Croceitalea sp. TaxID=1798908 RepID=UPI003305E964